MSDEVLMGRLTIGSAFASGDEALVEKVCNEMDVHTLNAVVTGVVFAMAAGESGIPAWLRAAERVLDARR